METKFLKVAEVAKILHVSKSFVYSEVAKEHIPCLKIGHRIIIPYSYIERLITQVKNA